MIQLDVDTSGEIAVACTGKIQNMSSLLSLRDSALRVIRFDDAGATKLDTQIAKGPLTSEGIGVNPMNKFPL